MRQQYQRRDMQSLIDDDTNSCISAVVESKLSPATAAVDRLKLLPDWECRHLRLLSDRDEACGDMIDENGDYFIYDFQILGYEKLKGGSFSMTDLSRISESISKECERSTRRRSSNPLRQSPEDIRKHYSIKKTTRGRDTITKKKRPLVRCIACEKHLAKLGASPSLVVYDR